MSTSSNSRSRRRLFVAPQAAGDPCVGRPRHIPLLAAIALGILLLAVAAYAATQIIGVGAPVGTFARLGTLIAFDGVGVPVAGVGSAPASASCSRSLCLILLAACRGG